MAFSERMPAHTQRAHFEPAWKGDSISGILKVKRQRLGPDGIRAVDINIQFAWNNYKRKVASVGGMAFCLHWGIPYLDNFKYIRVGTHCRKMTKREQWRHIDKWNAADVKRWRRAKNPDSEAPITYETAAKAAVRAHVRITGEIKSNVFRYEYPCAHLVAAAKRAQHPPWFMALYNKPGGKSMRYCREKCASVIEAGGKFAVIFGRYQAYRPFFNREVKQGKWDPRPTEVW